MDAATQMSCTITIPDNDGFAYMLQSVDLADKYAAPHTPSSAYWHARAASHLMMQGTFGPTRDGIAAISADTQQGGASSESVLEEWVLDQMAMPPTAHREYYRKHANARLDAPSEVGVPRSACMPNSRWNAVAIRADDQS